MFEEVQVLTHSSIRIAGSQVLYFDPFEVSEERHDADIVLVTHDHYDHYSAEDIRKVTKGDTWMILPECMKGKGAESLAKCEYIRPGETIEKNGIRITAVPAYNRIAPFHPKGKNYVGYLVTMQDVTYYVAGDTDMTAENRKVKCDVALLPIGGKFTMDYKAAAQLINEIKPKLVIPTHYGTVVGSPQDGQKFAELVEEGITVKIVI